MLSARLRLAAAAVPCRSDPTTPDETNNRLRMPYTTIATTCTARGTYGLGCTSSNVAKMKSIPSRHSATTASVPHQRRLCARIVKTAKAIIGGSGMEVSVPCLISKGVTFEEGDRRSGQAWPIEDDGQDEANDGNHQDHRSKRDEPSRSGPHRVIYSSSVWNKRVGSRLAEPHIPK